MTYPVGFGAGTVPVERNPLKLWPAAWIEHELEVELPWVDNLWQADCPFHLGGAPLVIIGPRLDHAYG